MALAAALARTQAENELHILNGIVGMTRPPAVPAVPQRLLSVRRRCAERKTLDTFGLPDPQSIPIGLLHSENLEGASRALGARAALIPRAQRAGPDADESNDYLLMVNRLVDAGANKGPAPAGDVDGYKASAPDAAAARAFWIAEVTARTRVCVCASVRRGCWMTSTTSRPPRPPQPLLPPRPALRRPATRSEQCEQRRLRNGANGAIK
jgi:hypothetical protein